MDVRSIVVAALADAEVETVAAIEAQITALGGDDAYALDSKFAEAVIARVSELIGRRLRGPADLPRSQFATIAALVYLIGRQVT